MSLEGDMYWGVSYQNQKSYPIIFDDHQLEGENGLPIDLVAFGINLDELNNQLKSIFLEK